MKKYDLWLTFHVYKPAVHEKNPHQKRLAAHLAEGLQGMLNNGKKCGKKTVRNVEQIERKIKIAIQVE